MIYNLHFRWTTSRARDTYGYNICTLLVDGIKVSACNGGGYDMQGSCLGGWVASFKDELRKLDTEFYGLTWHDPNYDPSQAIPDPEDGRTIAELEADGKFVDLDRYQQAYKASSKVPTDRHTEPYIDGACGFESVEKIWRAIGGEIRQIQSTKNHTYFTATI